jgi:hypothetical protein
LASPLSLSCWRIFTQLRGKSVLMDCSGVGLTRFSRTRSCSPGSRDAPCWPRLRMEVLRRDGYRCLGCGRPGDEITLRVCQGKTHGERPQALMSLCAICLSQDRLLANGVEVFSGSSPPPGISVTEKSQIHNALATFVDHLAVIG